MHLITGRINTLWVVWFPPLFARWLQLLPIVRVLGSVFWAAVASLLLHYNSRLCRPWALLPWCFQPDVAMSVAWLCTGALILAKRIQVRPPCVMALHPRWSAPRIQANRGKQETRSHREQVSAYAVVNAVRAARPAEGDHGASETGPMAPHVPVTNRVGLSTSRYTNLGVSGRHELNKKDANNCW